MGFPGQNYAFFAVPPRSSGSIFTASSKKVAYTAFISARKTSKFTRHKIHLSPVYKR
jgi:hypothetical protein